MLQATKQREIWYSVLLPFVLSRFTILLTGTVAITVGTVRSELWRVSESPWIDMWARWDSGWYLKIVADGYDYVEGAMSEVAFFPVFPLLIRVFSFGSQSREIQTMVGWLISNVAALFAFYVLFRLVTLDETKDVAHRTIWLLAFFPTSFFFSVVYTEGLFFLLTVAAFWLARKRRWLPAGICGAISAATRSIGVLLIPPLAYEWYRRKPRSWKSALALLLIPLGLVGFMVFLEVEFDNALAFSRVQGAWGRTLSVEAATVRLQDLLTDPELPSRARRVVTDLAFVGLGSVLLILLSREQRPSYSIYTAYALMIPLATLQVVSIPRYMLVAFPLFIMMAQFIRNPIIFRVALLAFALVQIAFVARWSLWYWVA